MHQGRYCINKTRYGNQLILYPFKLKRRASNKSLYEVCSLSREQTWAYAVRRLTVNLSNFPGMARYFWFARVQSAWTYINELIPFCFAALFGKAVSLISSCLSFKKFIHSLKIRQFNRQCTSSQVGAFQSIFGFIDEARVDI